MGSDPVIHVIDDDDDVRDSLVFLLETAGYASRAYASAEAFLAALPEAAAGCVVTDVRMPDMSGLDLTRRLKAMGSSFPVVVMTGHGDVPLAVEAMKAGVVDFIEKPFEDETLISAVQIALRAPVSAETEDPERLAIQARIDGLTGREKEVLNGLVAGQPNKLIAYDLGISPRTVEVYRANVMSKMQAGSLSELVRMVLSAQSKI